MKEAILNNFFNYEFIYIFLFCSVLCILVSIFIKQQIIRKISILFFSIFFIFFLFEYYLSFSKNNFFDYCNIQKKHKLYIPNKENKQIVKACYLQDKKLKTIEEHYGDMSFIDRNKNFYLDNYDIVFDGEYTVYGNSYGCFRYTLCDENSKEAYIFLGCSFTYGDGCNDNETVSYYFSKKFDFKKNVINLGLPGRSSNTALNILNNDVFAKLLVPQTDIKYFFYSVIEDQIHRNFSMIASQDYYLYKGNKFIYVKAPFSKIRYMFIHSYIFQKIFYYRIEEHNYKYYEDYMIKSLKEMDKIVREKYKSKLVVLLWNNNYKEYSENFLKQIKDSKLDYIFLPDRLNAQDDMYKSTYDLHPRYKANEEIAEILYNHINNL